MLIKVNLPTIFQNIGKLVLVVYQMIFNRSKNKYNLDKNVKALDALISLGS